MEVKLTEQQIDVIKKLAEAEGFSDYVLETKSGSSKGDNYLGIITTVSIKNHHKHLELILKSALDNDELRKKVPVRKVFLREIYFYDTIFPEFKKFETEHGFLEGFSAHAKLYGSGDKDHNEFLVLQNLKSVGYQMWDRKKPMTEDHIELVVKEYAKFHAVSFAMKEKRPEFYNKLSEGLTNVFAEMSTPEESLAMTKDVFASGIEAVKGDKVATEALERFYRTVNDFMQTFITDTDPNTVILHGDCWCNNMLFKYENTGIPSKPSKVCLIDWQVSWTGLPIIDLSYFLFACASKKILADYDKYLRIYYDSLCNSLKNLNCDPEIIYPFSSLENSWQKYVKFGIYLAMLLLKVTLGESEELPDLNDLANSGKVSWTVLTSKECIMRRITKGYWIL